jgi:nucleotidyltransferase/DNA polymerase involved in DNA repair
VIAQFKDDCIAIAKLSQTNRKATEEREERDYTAIVKRVESSSTTERLQMSTNLSQKDCAEIAQRLRRDCAEIAQRVRRDCADVVQIARIL